MTQLSSRAGTFGAILRVTSGNFLEQYDFFLFGFYATYIARTFFPAESEFAALMLTFAVFGSVFVLAMGLLMTGVIRFWREISPGHPHAVDIAEASHNVVLLQTMRGFFDLLHSSVKQSRQRMYLVPPVFARLTEQHQAVMEAIVAGDAEAARQAMMGHLGFVHATIKRFDEDLARQARITRLPDDHTDISREKKA